MPLEISFKRAINRHLRFSIWNMFEEVIIKASKIPTKQVVYWTIPNFTFYDCTDQINSNLDEWYDTGKLFPRAIR